MKYLRRHTARRVIVMLVDGTGIEGTVQNAEPEAVELTNSQSLQPDREPAPIDGTAVVRAESILWVQVL